MNLNEFEKDQISNFLNKRSGLTQDQKSQIASFINSKISETIKNTISEEEKQQISSFINNKNNNIDQPIVEKKKKTAKIDIDSIVEKVLQKIKSDNIFIETITSNILPQSINTPFDKNEVLTLLKSDIDFITSLIGEKGNIGEKGDKGDKGENGLPGKDAELDYEKLTNEVINKLKEDVQFITSLKSMGQISYSGGGLGYGNVLDLIRTYSTSGGSITGTYVANVNDLSGNIIIEAGNNINITESGNSIIISTSASGTGTGNSYFPTGW